jgi:hypothetical protein
VALAGQQLELCVPPRERATFIRALGTRRAEVEALFTNFDAREAKATYPEDRQQIVALIRSQFRAGLLAPPADEIGAAVAGRRTRSSLMRAMDDSTIRSQEEEDLAIDAFNQHVALTMRRALAVASWIV